MVLVGTHDHALDDKGRFVLPAKYRAHFAEAAYLAPGAGCVALWPAERFEQMVERLTEQVRTGEVDALVLGGLAASSEEVRPDAQGRVTVPERLRTLASLDREVVVCGAIDRIEVWDAATWATRVPVLDRTVADALLRGGGI